MSTYRAAMNAARAAAGKAGLKVNGWPVGHRHDTCRVSRVTDGTGIVVGQAVAFPSGVWSVYQGKQLVAEGQEATHAAF